MERLKHIGRLIFDKSMDDPVRVFYPEYAEIRDTAVKATKIWFTDGDDKSGKYKKAAEKVANLLREEIIADPRYAEVLSNNEHFRVMELLSTFVPEHDPEHADFLSSREFKLIDTYLRTYIPKWINPTDSEAEIFFKKNEIKRRSGFPTCYVDGVIGEIVNGKC